MTMNYIRSFFTCGAILSLILPFYLASTNTTKISVTVWRRGKALKEFKSHLCPKEGPGYAYNNATKVCEKLGYQGSCDNLMKFTNNASTPDYGYCECDFYRQCGRPVVRWPKTGKCYFVNEQGPCGSEEWLTLNATDKTPFCSPNICLVEASKTPSNGSTFWFASEGKCYQTNTRGYCENEQALLIFGREDVQPTCKFGLACGAINGTNALNRIIKTWNLSLRKNSSASSGGETIYTTVNL